MNVTIREMRFGDYEPVFSLWQTSDGIGLSQADSKERIGLFLDRNHGLSFVAEREGQLVGVALCGHDGRRGYIHHLAVHHSHRRLGIGRELVSRCLSALAAAGIDKCHLFVFKDNGEAILFWEETGWFQREEVTMMSRYVATSEQQPTVETSSLEARDSG